MQLKTREEIAAYFQTNDRPTQAEFLDLIYFALQGANKNYIVTSEGKLYDLTGLSTSQRGEQLVLAVSEATSNAKVVITIPAGEYDTSTTANGLIWNKRETVLLGPGRSQVCEVWSTVFDALTLDTAQILYNTIIRGVSFGTRAPSTKDAIKWTNVSGAAQNQSQIEIESHITSSTNDGLSLNTAINSCNIDLKLTTKSVDLTRYSVYVNTDIGGTNIIMRTDDAEVYLDSASANVSIQYYNQFRITATKDLVVTDLGTNNTIFSPSFIKSYRTDLQSLPISSQLNIPIENIVAFYPMDRTYSDVLPDASKFQNDGSKGAGTYAVVDSPWGRATDFSGDCYFEIPAHADLPTDKILVALMAYVDTDVNMRMLRIAGLVDINYTAGGTVNAVLTLNGTNRTLAVNSVATGKWLYIKICYDGTTARLEVNNARGENTWTGPIASMSSNPLRIGSFNTSSGFFDGKIGPILFLNNSTEELRNAVRASFLKNVSSSEALIHRFESNKIYNDIEWVDQTKGPIINDRNTASKYRLKVESGVLGIESV